jgi:hypothetical protein
VYSSTRLVSPDAIIRPYSRRLTSAVTAGGKVTSAGIIVVKQGYITKLNPHSGHYRSTIQVGPLTAVADRADTSALSSIY